MENNALLNNTLIKTFMMIIQNEEHRLPSSAHSLRPDCSTINLAETSEKPEAWLFHPIGITYEFVAKKSDTQSSGTGSLVYLSSESDTPSFDTLSSDTLSSDTGSPVYLSSEYDTE